MFQIPEKLVFYGNIVVIAYIAFLSLVMVVCVGSSHRIRTETAAQV